MALLSVIKCKFCDSKDCAWIVCCRGYREEVSDVGALDKWYKRDEKGE